MKFASPIDANGTMTQRPMTTDIEPFGNGARPEAMRSTIHPKRPKTKVPLGTSARAMIDLSLRVIPEG